MNMVKVKIKILKNDDMNLKNISKQIDKTRELNNINKWDEEEIFDDEIWTDFPFTKANGTVKLREM